MLTSPITLASEAFTRETYDLNRSVYHGASHTAAARHLLGFYRTYPKKTGNSYGVEKCSVKITIDHEVATVDGGTTVAPLICEVSFAMPVGVTDVHKGAIRADMSNLMNQGTIVDAILEQLSV